MRVAVLLLWLLPACSWAQDGALPPSVSAALQQANVAAKDISVWAQELGAEQPLLAFNADAARNPASAMKLLTTYAALDQLGPAYTWKTEAFLSGELKDGVLEGDLVIRGAGDPKLNLENFWLLLRELRLRGLREITGDLVLDRSFFALEDHDPARFDSDPARPYNAGPDALLVNYQTLRLQFIPDAQGRAVTILADPLPPQVRIVNNLALDSAPCGDWAERLKFSAQDDGRQAQLVFSGAFSLQCGEKERYFRALAPPDYAYGVFRQLWQELGGALNGAGRTGETPQDARLLASRESPPLAEIVRDVNKYSNNVMAQHLFLALGAQTGGVPATADKARAAVAQWLEKKGFAFSELVLENGAGLSRSERISARHLGELLAAAYRSRVMPEFLASLPLAAEDGTMKKRLNGSPVTGQARIKTGSLEGVRAIAGYLLDRKGRMVALVFFANGASGAQAQNAQDALLQWLYARP